MRVPASRGCARARRAGPWATRCALEGPAGSPRRGGPCPRPGAGDGCDRHRRGRRRPRRDRAPRAARRPGAACCRPSWAAPRSGRGPPTTRRRRDRRCTRRAGGAVRIGGRGLRPGPRRTPGARSLGQPSWDRRGGGLGRWRGQDRRQLAVGAQLPEPAVVREPLGQGLRVQAAEAGAEVLVELGDHDGAGRIGQAVEQAIRVGREHDRVPLGHGLEHAEHPGEQAGVQVHCLRDPTRGGLASALGEVAQAGAHGVCIDEPSIPVRPEVADACELLGLDPLRVACEGRLVAWVAPHHAAQALALLHATGCDQAAIIGEIVPRHPGMV
ncbi:MAG: hypothetical protein KDK70_36200, partial [Myxococcales bacterium]|nr:hypothetical protein [Myxococcales bacterium]